MAEDEQKPKDAPFLGEALADLERMRRQRNGSSTSPESDGADVTAEPQPALSDEAREAVEGQVREIAELKDSLLRTRADLENYRKRTERDRVQWVERAQLELVRQFLPVLDNFERAMESRSTADLDSFARGVEMILRQMMDVLGQVGIERMNAEGAPFDPHQHEAVSAVESAEVQEETVLHQMVPGYSFRGKVIRPAQVIVAKPSPSGDGSDGPTEAKPVRGMRLRDIQEALGEDSPPPGKDEEHEE